jgi:hypothetical protein
MAKSEEGASHGLCKSCTGPTGMELISLVKIPYIMDNLLRCPIFVLSYIYWTGVAAKVKNVPRGTFSKFGVGTLRTMCIL